MITFTDGMLAGKGSELKVHLNQFWVVHMSLPTLFGLRANLHQAY